eukprot:TRINITY_DN7693_c0_g2_i1.p1 TRINITY_DN7693_c0_g2~~TRINITY_DN7693_c0_g2_i1.p1  ORF type:complete len:495 (+),score=96.03 TRINITY_DN7693_c0_g2_i1:330-1814(+)
MVDSVNEVDDKLAYFQAITGLDDLEVSTQILQAHNWDLQSAISTVTDGGTSSTSRTANNSNEAELSRNSGLGLERNSGLLSEGSFAERAERSESLINDPANTEMANPANPGVVWRLVSLPFSIVRGSFGLLSGAIGLGFWVAGGVLSHSLSAIGWGSNNESSGGATSPLVSVSPGTSEALAFISLFEREYGSFHPNFQNSGFMDALRTSRQEFKFLFVYLHSPDHPNTPLFCRDTLCSESVVEFLNENFVVWGGNVRTSEGFRMSNSLKASTFPFCAIVMSANNQRIALLQQVEGPKSPAELLSLLQRVIEESGATLVAARIEEEERRHNRRLREEQDAAYQAALEADRAREQERQAEAERLRREAAEAERKRLEEEEAKARAAQEAAAREAALERRRQEKAMSLGAEPEKGPDVTQVLVRFPNGERKERRFYSSTSVKSVYDYVDSLNCLQTENYSLVSNFPRVVYGPEKHSLSLKEAGLHPQASLYVQVEDA